MRILVTGGAGFVGSRLVAALRQRGDEVSVLDDLSSGRREGLPPGVAFHQADVCDAVAVERVVSGFRPERMIHLAAQVSIPRSVRDPAGDERVNVGGGRNVLASALRARVGQFLFASSGGAIYGEVPEGERASERRPLRPASPYAVSKAAFERELLAVEPGSGLRPLSLRLSNVYGPGQERGSEARVVASFADGVLRGAPVTLFGRERAGDDGGIRDYVHVDDVAAAFLLGLDAKLRGVFNVGSGEGRTTRSVFDAVAAAAGLRCVPLSAPPRPFDLKRTVLDAAAITAAGWRPSVPFDRGIRETVEAYRRGTGA